MGIPRPVARLLFEEGRARPFRGSVLQIGRCFVFLRWDELEHWAARDEFPLRRQVEIELSHDPLLAREGCISDRTLFRALGFDLVESLDLRADESPTHLHDLNLPVPTLLEERFDVVFDPGSLVHVFDQRTAFRNVARMVRPNGRVIHGTAPSSNHVDLGLFMYSPTLIADYYEANGWRLESLKLCEFEPLWYRHKFEPPVWRIRSYAPGDLDLLRLGGLDWRPRSVWAVATKVRGATDGVAPIQHCFRLATPRAHPADASREAVAARAPATVRATRAAMTSAWARVLVAGRPIKRLWRRLKRPLRRLPPIVANL